MIVLYISWYNDNICSIKIYIPPSFTVIPSLKNNGPTSVSLHSRNLSTICSALTKEIPGKLQFKTHLVCTTPRPYEKYINMTFECY